MVAENSIVCRAAGVCARMRLDVGQEAEVEHLVGLVEHDALGRRRGQVPLLGQVEQPAGRADDDLDAAACSASTCGS